MADVTCIKVDEVFMEVRAERGVLQELSEFFTFEVPGARYMPSVKNGIWDGCKRLFNYRNQQIYIGLLPHLALFCKERGYSVECDWEVSEDVNEDAIVEFFKSTPMPFKPRDSQLKAFLHVIKRKRALILSPTSSGKSFIIYLLWKWFGKQTLLIVPTTNLVRQMVKDLLEYGADPEDIQIIMEGESKKVTRPIVISTWQSIYQQPKRYFEQFEVVLGDEAHGFKAASLTKILESCTKAEVKVGLTGTLDGAETHKLILEGLFGRVVQFTTSREMIAKGEATAVQVKAITLEHSDDVKRALKKAKYPEEMDYLVKNEKRNKFIVKIASQCKGNTIVLFQYVQKHGKVLLPLLEALGRPVFFVSGEVDSEVRDEIRGIVENETDAIIIASFGTFSTGVNIKNLHNAIFGSPSKSRIRVLQSLGRGMRLHESKEAFNLYDVADDLRWSNWMNHTLKHFMDRLQYYAEEGHPVKHFRFKL